VPTDWQNATRSHDREKLISAREAAEALFRPQRQAEDHAVPDAVPRAPSVADEGPGRKTRVFVMPQMKPVGDERHDTPAPAAAPETKRARGTLRLTKVPASHHARIRTLATHGMNLEQVAEHYGVGVGEIERVLAASRETLEIPH
jgi:hypothetical protein